MSKKKDDNFDKLYMWFFCPWSKTNAQKVVIIFPTAYGSTKDDIRSEKGALGDKLKPLCSGNATARQHTEGQANTGTRKV